MNKVLKTSVAALVELNMLKNITVYVVAGFLDGFKARASNIVFDVFIDICQDPIQNMGAHNAKIYISLSLHHQLV